MTKDQNLLRTSLRNTRKQLSPLRRHLDSVRICRKLIQHLPTNNSVASYISTPSEVSTHSLNKVIKRKGHTLLTPVVRPQHQLAFVACGEQLKQRNQYGINQARYTPARARKLTAGTTIIVPLLGFDQQCNRIGMGGGYYDRLLVKHKRCNSIGLAFATQQLRSIPTRPWDQALTMVVTPQYRLKRLRQK